jgi:hypothetical protein
MTPLERAIRAGYEAVVEQSRGPLSAHDAVRLAAPALVAAVLADDAETINLISDAIEHARRFGRRPGLEVLAALRQHIQGSSP